jgi:hypothetical protein
MRSILVSMTAALVVVACTRVGLGSLPLTVAPTYPENGSQWNSYVLNDGFDVFGARDLPCSGYEIGYDRCIHGGEARSVVVPGLHDCEDLALHDALGAFNWTCRTVNGTATFFSTGFKRDRGLADLVTASGWKPNNVALDCTRACGESEPSIWWNNPVFQLPANPDAPPMVLDDVDDDADGPDAAFPKMPVFVAPASQTTAGYVLGMDGASLVVLRDAALTVTAATVRGVLVEDQRFVWIEGQFVGPGSNLTFSGTRMSRMHRVTIDGTETNGFGILVEHAMSNRLTEIKVQNLVSEWTAQAVRLRAEAHGNLLQDLTLSNIADRGLVLSDSDHNVIHRLVAARTGAWGLNVMLSDNNRMSELVIGPNGGGWGISLGSASGNVITNAVISGVNTGIAIGPVNPGWAVSRGNTVSCVTVLNGGEHALYLGDSSGTTVQSFAALNHAASPLRLNGTATAATFSQLALIYPGYDALCSQGNATSNKFLGALILDGPPPRCVVSGTGFAPGVIDNTCTDTGEDGSSTYAGQLSTAVLRPLMAPASPIVGKVAVNDPTNTSDEDGTADFPVDPALFDWTGFGNSFRTWGRDGSDFPNRDQLGGWTQDRGRIWDLRLRRDDTILLNRSGDGANANEPFVADRICPRAAWGDRVATDQREDAPDTYLLSAVEQLFDGIGDDDGLCESYEACLYTPNFGAYQGHGELAPCLFEANAGPVVGVTIDGYVENGVP